MKDKRKEYFSIPNLLGYFRILLVPVYLFLYARAESTRDYYAAAGVMLLSFFTDFLDGKIARKFHMITEFGKILDPVADKITQGALALSFAFRYPAVSVLLLVFVLKELIMGALGLYMMRRGYRMNGASMHGKVCTALLDGVMLILLLAVDIPYLVVNLLTGACMAVMLISLTLYLKMYYRVFRDMKKSGDKCGKHVRRENRRTKG